jgi:hypothetical protein
MCLAQRRARLANDLDELVEVFLYAVETAGAVQVLMPEQFRFDAAQRAIDFEQQMPALL